MAQIAPLHNGGRTFDKSGDVSKRKSNLGHTEKVRREVTTTWHADIRGMPASSAAARLLGFRMATNFQGNLPVCPPVAKGILICDFVGDRKVGGPSASVHGAAAVGPLAADYGQYSRNFRRKKSQSSRLLSVAHRCRRCRRHWLPLCTQYAPLLLPLSAHASDVCTRTMKS